MFKFRRKLAFVYLLSMVLCFSSTFIVFADDGTEGLNEEMQNEAAQQEVAADAEGEAEDGGGETGNTAGGTDINVNTGSAIADIMDDARFNGAVSSIAWLTKITDKYFAMAITLVAFFIISAALLKNACAGAYCANSKFWDKVDDAHKKSEAFSLSQLRSYVTGGGVMNTTPAGIKDFLLGIVPNIKAFTDFEGRELEPKQYFMKAIPQMLACIIIGVFIYNGYYRDTASVVGSFGAETFERVMASADPVGLADRIFSTTGTPKIASDYDTSVQGKYINDIAHGAYTAIVTTYTDIQSAEAKGNIMNQCEEWATEIAGINESKLSDSDSGGQAWKNKVKVYLSTGPAGDNASGDDGDEAYHVASIAIGTDKTGDGHSAISFDSTKHGTTGYYYVTCASTFVRKSATLTEGGSATATSGAKNLGYDDNGNSYPLIISVTAPSSGNCTVDGFPGKGLKVTTNYAKAGDASGSYSTKITFKNGSLKDGAVGTLATSNGEFTVKFKVTTSGDGDTAKITGFSINGKSMSASDVENYTGAKK